MSILIKNMSLPKHCSNCPFLNKNYDTLSGLFSVYCSLNGFDAADIIPSTIDTFYTVIEKEKYCPLIEVPPHGRLIDADKLVNYQLSGRVKTGDTLWDKQTWLVFPNYSQLSDIPTVLEADYDSNISE